MQDQAISTLKSGAPWRQGIGWPIVAAEGLILLLIGGYILIDQEGSADVVRQLLGIVLLGNGLADVVIGLRRRDAAAAPFRMLRGGVGITAGTFVVFENVSDYLDPDTSRIILAFGFLAFGLIGLLAAIAGRNEGGGLRLGALVSGGLAIALSVVLFTGDTGDTSRLNLFATIFLVFGALLLGYAYMIFRGARSAAGTAVDSAGAGADVMEGAVVSDAGADLQRSVTSVLVEPGEPRAAGSAMPETPAESTVSDDAKRPETTGQTGS